MSEYECSNAELNRILKELTKRRSKWYYPTVIALAVFLPSFLVLGIIIMQRTDDLMVMVLAINLIVLLPIVGIIIGVRRDHTLMFDLVWIVRAHGVDKLYAIINDVQEYTDRRKPFYGKDYIFYPRRGFLIIYSDIEGALVEEIYISHGDDGGYHRTDHKLVTIYGREAVLKSDDLCNIQQNISGLKVYGDREERRL
jgi:hypothetical protein